MKSIFRATLVSGMILEIYAETAGNRRRLYARGPFHIGPGQTKMCEITEFSATPEKISWTVRSVEGGLQEHEALIKGF